MLQKVFIDWTIELTNCLSSHFGCTVGIEICQYWLCTNQNGSRILELADW